MAGILLTLLICGCISNPDNISETKVVVFHAGSLSIPFEKIEKEYELTHPGVDIRRESMGSVKAVRQITDVGKEADVIASADYTLIRDMMYPEYANWTVRFATNDMVLAYNPQKSLYADEVTEENWYDILRRDDVIFGFSNPNLDPCGYRAVMVLQLSELLYSDERIFDDLILDQTKITVIEENSKFLINTPEDMGPNTRKVTIRPKSVELVAFLEQGGIDYAFEYRSVAVQHNLSFVDLPSGIDLSDIAHIDTYSRVRLQTVDGKTKTAKPIVYGISVPRNALNPDAGLEFIEFVIGERGQQIFDEMGQPPIVPAKGEGEIPEKIKELIH